MRDALRILAKIDYTNETLATMATGTVALLSITFQIMGKIRAFYLSDPADLEYVRSNFTQLFSLVLDILREAGGAGWDQFRNFIVAVGKELVSTI
jgi:hypothetical protein